MARSRPDSSTVLFNLSRLSFDSNPFRDSVCWFETSPPVPILCVVGKNREVSSTDFDVPDAEIGGPTIVPESDPDRNRVVTSTGLVVAWEETPNWFWFWFPVSDPDINSAGLVVGWVETPNWFWFWFPVINCVAVSPGLVVGWVETPNWFWLVHGEADPIRPGVVPVTTKPLPGS